MCCFCCFLLLLAFITRKQCSWWLVVCARIESVAHQSAVFSFGIGEQSFLFCDYRRLQPTGVGGKQIIAFHSVHVSNEFCILAVGRPNYTAYYCSSLPCFSIQQQQHEKEVEQKNARNMINSHSSLWLKICTTHSTHVSISIYIHIYIYLFRTNIRLLELLFSHDMPQVRSGVHRPKTNNIKHTRGRVRAGGI